MNMEIVWPVVLTGIVSLGIALFVKALQSKQQLEERIRRIELDVAVSQTQLTPLWAQVQAKLTEDLHHDDARFHEADRLIEKLTALTITGGERHRLKELMAERVADPATPNYEAKKAKALIAVMDLVLIETKESEDAEVAKRVWEKV